MTNRALVIIPARMASARLPGKPLADIAGAPMIVHVWRAATAAAIGPVVVAAGDEEIAAAVTAAGGAAVLTEPDLASGSDRVAAAAAMVDPERQCAIVVNLQGDLPTIAPEVIATVTRCLADSDADIATLASPIADEDERANPNVVKLIGALDGPAGTGEAVDFRRRLPPGEAPPHFHHIGIYAYRRDALERFVALPPSRRERARRLEQMRALDAGMRIIAARVDTVPFGVDTPADLDRARRLLEQGATPGSR